MLAVEKDVLIDSVVSISASAGSVDSAERTRLLGQKGATLWFTGLSASGKVGIG